MLKKLVPLAAFLGSAVTATLSFADTVVVNQFSTYAGTITPDAWYYSDVQGSGTASIQAKSGGPLGSSAAKLTTTSNNADKAVVGTYRDFGLASTVLQSINLSYSYYKSANNLENAAAPSLKLEITGLAVAGQDHYGQLIYEPYWNTGTGTVPTDSWQSVSIDQNTGAGDSSAGGWWWNGGFGQGNSAGGPPLRSLDEWLALFASDPYFYTAHVTGLLVGVGSYNPGQTDYFDGVHITTGSLDKTYDFEAQAQAVPDSGTTLCLFGVGLAGIAFVNAFVRRGTCRV